MRRFRKVVYHNTRPEIQDIGNKRLMYIGAICLTWNSIEEFVDSTLALCLKLDRKYADEVTSRIGGFDGKVG